MRVLYFHERPSVSGSTVSLALAIEALGGRVEPWVATPPGPAAAMLGKVAHVVETPSAGLMHIWSGVYTGARWSLLAAHAAAMPRHLIAVRRLLRRLEPDIVHVNDVTQLPSALLASRLGFPVVLHTRAALPPRDESIRSRLIRRAIRRVDMAVAINQDVADSYGRPPNMVVVPNPVRLPPPAPEHGPQAKAALGLPSGRPAIGFVGHLYGPKGWLQLLEAVGMLVHDGIDVCVVLAGAPLRSSGWHRTHRGRVLAALAGREDATTALDAAVVRLGLREHLHAIGWRDDMTPIYEALDVVCAPSQGPELSRPVLEAQAHGRPVLAVSRTGGGVVENGRTGMLVERASPEALAERLRTLVQDRDLRERLGSAARVHAEREYSQDVVRARLGDAYDRALALHGSH